MIENSSNKLFDLITKNASPCRSMDKNAQKIRFTKRDKSYIAFAPYPRNIAALMSVHHWKELFYYEQMYSPIDWIYQPETKIFEMRQPNMPREHRHKIINWMSEACVMFRWSTQSYFIAVHAWDYYMFCACRNISQIDLAKISASCLYFGAQLAESAADENMRTFDEFVTVCPEVGSAAELRKMQACLIDALQGISLAGKTPIDLTILFLVQLQSAPEPFSKIFSVLLEKQLVELMCDLCVATALIINLNGLILDGLPISFWIIGAMITVIEYSNPKLRGNLVLKKAFCETVFRVSFCALQQLRHNVLNPLICAIWQVIAGKMASKSAFNYHANSRVSASTNPTNSILCDLCFQSVIQRLGFSSLAECSISLPSNAIVQNASDLLKTILARTQ